LSVHLIKELFTPLYLTVWVSFLAGLGGSLHCVGMCGGLVSASCSQTSDIFRYQIGRLLGYLALGALGAFTGQLIQFSNQPYISLISAIIIGLMFILWGIQSLLGKKQSTGMLEQKASILYGKLWKRFVFQNKTMTKSFFTGLVSIFLPCGLLYGVVISQAALAQTSGQFYQVFLSMGFFWLGTIPAMVLAPKIVQKILGPMRSKMPKVFAISLMLIGLSTISFRMMRFSEHQANNHNQHSPAKMKCH
jgi:sulfite exporter TauE/SafE